ncbi:MAG: hypothetical protein ACE5R6_05650 [Candidatus Heimdallarchaeota archaeon]
MEPESPKKEIKRAYRRYAKKLQEMGEKTDQSGQRTLQQRVKAFQKSFDTLIAPPPELVAKLILTKKIAGLPPILDEIKVYKEPKLLKKEEFRARLAIDLICYGIHSQRTTGKLLSIDKFVESFLRDRAWCETTPKTIRELLHSFIDQGVVTTTKMRELVFEPIELSQDIGQVLLIVETKKAISLKEICIVTKWAPEKAHFVIAQLEKEGIAIYDHIERVYYFPALDSQRTG